MPDDRLAALGAPGQRTAERTGGSEERRLALKETLALILRRCIEVAWLLLAVPLLAGPWILVYYVPAAYNAMALRFARWMDPVDAPDRVDPMTLLAFAALTLGVLLVLPDGALAWWPFAWQRSRADWYWLRMHPLALVLRAVLLVAPWRAWTMEERYLTNRQRQEVVAPTLSGVAYATADPHNVAIAGVVNPHRNPEAPKPANNGGDLVVRYVPARELDDSARENQRVEVVLPIGTIARPGEHMADTLRRVEGLVSGMLMDGRASRSALMSYGLTRSASEDLQRWMMDRDYAVDRGDGAGCVVTDLGRRWLAIVERHLPPF